MNGRNEWQKYKNHLIFQPVEPRTLTGAVRDKDDLPFIFLSKMISSRGILTGDKDISGMGGETIPFEVRLYLKDYARSKVIAVEIQFFGMAMGVAALAGVFFLLKGLISLIKTFPRLPDWVKLVIIGGALIVAFHPTRRERIRTFILGIGDQGKLLWQKAQPLMDEYIEQSNKAKAALEKVESELPKAKKVPLRHYAFEACRQADRPLHIDEIYRRVLNNGYKTKSKRFRYYLHNVLMADARLRMHSEGYWQVI